MILSLTLVHGELSSSFSAMRREVTKKITSWVVCKQMSCLSPSLSSVFCKTHHLFFICTFLRLSCVCFFCSFFSPLSLFFSLAESASLLLKVITSHSKALRPFNMRQKWMNEWFVERKDFCNARVNVDGTLLSTWGQRTHINLLLLNFHAIYSQFVWPLSFTSPLFLNSVCLCVCLSVCVCISPSPFYSCNSFKCLARIFWTELAFSLCTRVSFAQQEESSVSCSI